MQRQIHVETQLTEIACALVAAGAGVSVVDPLMAAEFSTRGVAVRPFRPRIEVEFGALYSSQRKLSGVAREFVEAFRRDLAEFVGRQPRN